MFLLILNARYVDENLFLYLHSTMFLLIRGTEKMSVRLEKNLHSTMFLLIRIKKLYDEISLLFTFHNVSINS